MSPNFTDYAELYKAQALEIREEKRTKYHEILSPTVKSVRGLKPEAEERVLLCSRIAGDIAKKYPKSDFLPPRLDQLTNIALHANLLEPLRSRYNRWPERASQWLDGVENISLDSFKHYTPEILSKDDISFGQSLCSEVAWLKAFPEAVAAIVGLIEEWLVANTARSYKKPPATTPPKIANTGDPHEPAPRWDPRS